MLEPKWGYLEDKYMDGLSAGFAEGVVEARVRNVKAVIKLELKWRKLNKEGRVPPPKIKEDGTEEKSIEEVCHELYEIGRAASEKAAYMYDYIEKNIKLSDEVLENRLWKESEYWLPGIDW